jgi:hypothetical protein
MAEDDLEKLADEMVQTPSKGSVVVGGTDTSAVRGLGVLTKAILRLDRTSSRLAIITIVLTVVIILVGIVQIVLMLRGR